MMIKDNKKGVELTMQTVVVLIIVIIVLIVVIVFFTTNYGENAGTLFKIGEDITSGKVE